MAHYMQKLIEDDFVWNALTSAISTETVKRTHNGFLNINCPMCVHRGHRADRRYRCGLRNNSPGVGIHCFNCDFRTSWLPGSLLTRNIREFLSACGVADIEIARLNHRAMAYRSLVESSPEAQALVKSDFSIKYDTVSLPKGARTLTRWAEEGCDSPDFQAAAAHAIARGDDVLNSTDFFWTPEAGKSEMHKRLIIPFFWEGKVVGWTGRHVNPQTKDEHKYHSRVQPNFLFNNRVLTLRERKYVIITEGIFDALAIDGVGVMRAQMSDTVAAWIDGSGKVPIVLPDLDETGTRLIDLALRRKWAVAFPRVSDGSVFNWWDKGVKDASDAVLRYGRLYTLTSILKSAESDPTGINVKRRMFERSAI